MSSVAGSVGVVGMDIARTSNPPSSHGSATGFVNVGGFSASLTMMFLIGVALDVVDQARGGAGVPAELYSLPSFRIAFLVQFLVVGVGIVFLLQARRRTRRKLLVDEGIEVSPLWVAIMAAWRSRGR